MKVLLVEGSSSLRKNLTMGLRHCGFTVDATGDGSEGLSMALREQYDLLILEIMLPSLDGMSLLKALRKENQQVRVLILSAKTQPEERVLGLLSGADDYMTKPFSFDELHARLLCLMRRGTLNISSNIIRYDMLTLDLQLKVLKAGDDIVDLTPNEFKIIECLFTNQNKVITAKKLSSYITGNYDRISKNALEAHISSARKKFKLTGYELPIQTKRGFGYFVKGLG
ncbi:response regulator transcription factor [Alteromonas sp. a30]|uniref:response regulator transcription factor n=1 Tax=Alteromonas sp. a30 TaxID=2730917 RepID=UPI00227DF127|nr:response regulator transcription factor [Alteromonas sp. a30]MCY7295900.1 response regulator transcription factor [Alteromonas sp. a30]